MASKSQEQLQDRIERVIAHLRDSLARQPGLAQAAGFMRRYFERVALADIEEIGRASCRERV
mgnify:CR=1 FL=1